MQARSHPERRRQRTKLQPNHRDAARRKGTGNSSPKYLSANHRKIPSPVIREVKRDRHPLDRLLSAILCRFVDRNCSAAHQTGVKATASASSISLANPVSAPRQSDRSTSQDNYTCLKPLSNHQNPHVIYYPNPPIRSYLATDRQH
jgi:hypothetical protein